VFIQLILFAVILFMSAGRIDWLWAWVYLGFFILGNALFSWAMISNYFFSTSVLFILRTAFEDRTLLEELEAIRSMPKKCNTVYCQVFGENSFSFCIKKTLFFDKLCQFLVKFITLFPEQSVTTVFKRDKLGVFNSFFLCNSKWEGTNFVMNTMKN